MQLTYLPFLSISLVCQFLLVAQFIQMTTKSVSFGLKGIDISFVGLEGRQHEPETQRRFPVMPEIFPVTVRTELSNQETNELPPPPPPRSPFPRSHLLTQIRAVRKEIRVAPVAMMAMPLWL